MYTNHELAKAYELKSKLLGKSYMEFKLLPNDRVQLIRALETNRDNLFIIPRFITDFYIDLRNGLAPFVNCIFTEIYIDNKPNKPLDISYLFFAMRSKRIRVRLAHPECLVRMSHTFFDCYYARSLDISGFDTSNTTDMQGLFSGCNSLISLDVSHFNTSKVTNMAGVFEGCSELTELDLSNFNTLNVKDMSNMFKACRNLKTIKLTSFNTSRVKSFACMFEDCAKLERLDISNFNFSSAVYIRGMLHGCNREEISVNFDTWHNPAPYSKPGIDIGKNCMVVRKIEYKDRLLGYQIKTENGQILNVFEAQVLMAAKHGMISNARYSKLNRALIGKGCCKISELPTIGYAELSDRFFEHTETNHKRRGSAQSFYPDDLIEFVKINLPEKTNHERASEYESNFITAYTDEAPLRLAYFRGDRVRLEHVSNSKLTDKILIPRWITDFNTQSKYRAGLFSGCEFKEIDIDNSPDYEFNADRLFSSMDSETLIVKFSHPEKIISMQDMFKFCSKLRRLDISSFDTSNVKTMRGMFYYCSALEELDLSHFDDSSLTDTTDMFYGCSNLNVKTTGLNWTPRNI